MKTIIQEPVYINLSGVVGDDIAFELTWKNADKTVFNFTGYSALLQFKVKKTDATAALSLTSSDGIVLGSTAPNIKINISKTRSLALGVGSWFYDIELTSSLGKIRTWISGTFVLLQDVTRVVP